MKIDPDILGGNIFSFCVSVKNGPVLQSRENKPVCYNSVGFLSAVRKLGYGEGLRKKVTNS